MHPRVVPTRSEDRLPIKVLRAANVLFTRCYHTLEVRSAARLPRHGAGILVCNHVSGIDPLLIQAPLNRLVTWMMAAEYYDLKPLAPIFRTLGVIPVQRSGRDSASLRAALRTLGAGQILGIFPEGRISPNHTLLPFQTGVAMIAIKTGVPVYPAYLTGSQRGKEMLPAFLTPNHAILRFGRPIRFARPDTGREALDVATERIRNAIVSLATDT